MENANFPRTYLKLTVRSFILILPNLNSYSLTWCVLMT